MSWVLISYAFKARVLKILLYEANSSNLVEVKASRQTLDKSFAVPESYDGFFSFPTIKGGYSGTAVYTKSANIIPLKAEEGLSGTLQSGLKPPLTIEEHVSSSYPEAVDIALMEDEVSNTHTDLAELDKEGRALVLDFGLFVLFNLYCPNETSDARLPYKMNFNLLLAERVRRLVEIDKREVIVTGDINICAAPIDHCDGELPSNRDEYWVHPARKWLHEWLAPIGPMVDVVRQRWPDRKGMYTCGYILVHVLFWGVLTSCRLEPEDNGSGN